MNTCPKCGSANNPDSKFCFSCGNPLSQSTPVSPNPLFPPIQAQTVNPPYQPYIQQIPIPQQVPVTPYSQIPYAQPVKSKKNRWIMIASIFAGLVAILSLVLTLTSLGSTVLGYFGLGKGAQFEKYYNDYHVPIYHIEASLVQDLNSTLLNNKSPDIKLVYQKADEWKAGFDEVVNKYANITGSIDSDLWELNDLSVSRATRMKEAMDLLKQAIEQDSMDIYDNQFIPKINEYNNLYSEWQAKVQEWADKYNYTITNK